MGGGGERVGPAWVASFISEILLCGLLDYGRMETTNTIRVEEFPTVWPE